MREKRALIFRIMAAATGDRSTTVMLCGAGMCGLTANKIDGGTGLLCGVKSGGEKHGK